MEEAILFEKYPYLLEEEMADLKHILQKEQDEYFAARDRSVSRVVSARELDTEMGAAFQFGLRVASQLLPMDSQLDPALIVPESNFGLGVVLGFAAKMEAIKGKQYGGSWMRRGERDGALVNVQRKFDRLEQALNPYQEREFGDDTVCDSLGDLLVYCGKWLTLRAQTHPEEFRRWLLTIQNL